MHSCTRRRLYRIATNTAYDYLRRQRRIIFTALSEEMAWIIPVPMETEWDDAEPVWDALRLVPAHDRLPLLLQTRGGYALEDMAKILGCGAATVKTRVHRARKHFRQHYIVCSLAAVANTRASITIVS